MLWGIISYVVGSSGQLMLDGQNLFFRQFFGNPWHIITRLAVGSVRLADEDDTAILPISPNLNMPQNGRQNLVCRYGV